MIGVWDNLLGKTLISKELERVVEEGFDEHIVGDKSFYVNIPSKEFEETIITALQEIHRANIDKIFSFIRVATDKLDTDWRIHSDLNIMGQRPDRAAVLYISPRANDDVNGTTWSYGPW